MLYGVVQIPQGRRNLQVPLRPPSLSVMSSASKMEPDIPPDTCPQISPQGSPSQQQQIGPTMASRPLAITLTWVFRLLSAGA